MQTYCRPFCVSFTPTALGFPWLVKYTLEACPTVLSLSKITTLIPPPSFAEVTTSVVVREKMQPEVPEPAQSAVIPQKKKSVPEVPILGLKNSVIGEHRERVEFTIWVDLAGDAFILTPVKPKM